MRVAIVGSGVVGTATGLAHLHKGTAVTFVDSNRTRVEELKNQVGLPGASFQHASDMELDDTSLIYVSVPTPTINGSFKVDHIVEAIENIAAHLWRLQSEQPMFRVVAIRSTILPGTIHAKVIPCFEQVGLRVGEDVGICFCPEYLRARVAVEDARNPRLLVIGANDQKTFDHVGRFYANFNCPLVQLSIVEAEFQKYTHNLLNATIISFFNEMRMAASQLGIDPEQVFELTGQSAEARWNPLYGAHNHGPFGGACLPKDTQAFLSHAEDLGIPMPLLSAVITVNRKLQIIVEQEAA